MRRIDPIFKKILGYFSLVDRLNVTFVVNIANIYFDYLYHSTKFATGAEKVAIEKLRRAVNDFILTPWLDAHKNNLPNKSKEFHRLINEYYPEDLPVTDIIPPTIKLIPYHGIHRWVDHQALKPNGIFLSYSEIYNAVKQLNVIPRAVIQNKLYIRIKNNYYYLYHELSSANFIKDYLAQNMTTGEIVVIKKYRHEENDFCTELYSFENEFNITTELGLTKGALRYSYKEHRLGLFGLFDKTKIKKTDLYLALTLKPGMPLSHLKSKNASQASWLRRIKSMLLAVKQLHDANIFHGQLTLSKFLCDDNDNITLIDYRFSSCFSADSDFIEVHNQFLNYLKAPECFYSKFTRATEVYMVALAIIDLLGFHLGKRKVSTIKQSALAAHDFSDKKTLGTFIKSTFSYIPTQYNFDRNKSRLGFDEQIDLRLISLLNRMLHVIPTQRPSLQSCINVLDRILDRSADIVVRFQKVGLVEFEDIYDRQKTINPSFIPIARLMDAIYIVTDKTKMPHTPVNAVQNLLTQAGVTVLGELHSLHDTYGTEKLLVSAHQLREQINHQLHVSHYFYLTSKHSIPLLHNHYFEENNIIRISVNPTNDKDYYRSQLAIEPKVTLGNFIFLIKIMGQELERLENDYSGELKPQTHEIVAQRKAAMMLLMKEFIISFNKNALRHVEAINKLERLALQMHHTNPIHAALYSSFSLFSSIGAKRIETACASLSAKEIRING